MGSYCGEHQTQSLGQLWEKWRLALPCRSRRQTPGARTVVNPGKATGVCASGRGPELGIRQGAAEPAALRDPTRAAHGRQGPGARPPHAGGSRSSAAPWGCPDPSPATHSLAPQPRPHSSPCPRPARAPPRLTGAGSRESLAARRPRQPGYSVLGDGGGGAEGADPEAVRGRRSRAEGRQPGRREGGGDLGPRARSAPASRSVLLGHPLSAHAGRGARGRHRLGPLLPHLPQGQSCSRRAPRPPALHGAEVPRVWRERLKAGSEPWRERPPRHTHTPEGRQK